MARAALRLLGFCLGAAVLRAATPAPMAAVRIGKIEYVRATDVAARLRLAEKWQGPARLLLLDAAGRVEVPAPGATDFREISVNGLKVWLGDPAVLRAGQAYFSRVDFEDRLLPLLRPDLVRTLPPRPHVIALDPGHGGSDSGAKNPRLGLMEKTATLDVALRLRKLLTQAGYEVVLTRTTDLSPNRKLDLPDRAEIANVHHADLFLSIHFNAGSPSDFASHGTEVFTFPPQHQRSTEHWADRDDDSEPNRAQPKEAPVLRFAPWNVILARAMHAELHRRLNTEDRGEKIAHWGTLRGLNCPGILVESAFITTDAEGRRVATPAFRQEIAEAMLAGINAYAAEINRLHPATAITPPAAFPAPPPAPGKLLPPLRPT